MRALRWFGIGLADFYSSFELEVVDDLALEDVAEAEILAVCLRQALPHHAGAEIRVCRACA